MSGGLVIVGICAVGVGGIALFIFMNRKKKADAFEVFQTEKLLIEDVISWYRKPSNLSLMKENPSAIAVLLRDEEMRKMFSNKKDVRKKTLNASYFQGIFDKEKGEVISGRFIQCGSIEEELENMFDGKDMVIFS
jgi:hypothetical protein